jgi:hypothetical protein
MKVYTDVFKKPLSVADVSTATAFIVKSKRPSMYTLQRTMGMGAGKAMSMVRLLEDAGVITQLTKATQDRTVILKSEPAAVNAALRQLRKGNA